MLSRVPWLELKEKTTVPLALVLGWGGASTVNKRCINKLDWQKKTRHSLKDLYLPGASNKPQLCDYKGLTDGEKQGPRMQHQTQQ